MTGPQSLSCHFCRQVADAILNAGVIALSFLQEVPAGDPGTVMRMLPQVMNASVLLAYKGSAGNCPDSRDACSATLISAIAADTVSSRLPLMTTVAPAFAKASAIPLPIP